VSSNDVRIQFGKEVRAWRGRLGISQEELAERAGLHRTYVSDIERGARNVSLGSVERLARAFSLPVATLFAPNAITTTPPPPADPLDGELVDILYVEDNPDDVELTLRALKKANIQNQIHVVGDGTAALDFLFCTGPYEQRQRTTQPEMVLLDLNLPKIGGVEVLRRIKASPQTRDIPVVVLTVSRRHPDIFICKQLGAEAYIVKPIDLKNLGDVAQQLCMHWALIKTRTPRP
jgi:CheY-like chemotaxis protein